MSYHLRDYQVQAHDAMLAAWETHRSGILALATSAGKTVIAAKLMETLTRQGKRCLFVADTDELVDQVIKKLYAATGLHCAVEKAESRASLMADIVIGSEQTMARENRIQRFPKDHFDYIFFDEIHRGTHRCARITEHFHTAKTCGITATSFRMGLKDLSRWFETVAYELGTFDLIGRGYAVPIHAKTLPVTIDLSAVKQGMSANGQDYNADGLDGCLVPYFAEIIKLVKEHGAGRQILAFLPLIKTSLLFVQMCKDADIEARHIDGGSDDRAKLLEGFERREFQLLSNCSLLTTGWDCPSADCLLNLRPTRSAGLFRQMTGRILRVLPGVVDGIDDAGERCAAIAASAKPNALILDLLYQTERLKLAGPASLIAMDEREADDIAKRLRDSDDELDIERVTHDARAEREAALRQALEDAPLTSGMLDARAYGYLLHEPLLMDYVPVTQAHQQPVTEDQRKYLSWSRINPVTVNSFGHARALLEIDRLRKKDGLAPIFTVFRLSRQGIQGAEKMTQAQANEIAGEPLWGIGKNAGIPISQMPERSKTWWRETFFTDKPHMAERYPAEAAWCNFKLPSK